MVVLDEEPSHMITRQHRQSPLRRLWMPLLTAAFLGYFGFHTFNGSYGKWALDRMNVQAAALESQLADLKREREELAKRVSFLRPESLDADLVDVEARTQLNVIRPDEIVVSLGATQQAEQ
jgi:cell division protein FtsB